MGYCARMGAAGRFLAAFNERAIHRLGLQGKAVYRVKSQSLQISDSDATVALCAVLEPLEGGEPVTVNLGDILYDPEYDDAQACQDRLCATLGMPREEAEMMLIQAGLFNSSDFDRQKV